MAYFCRWHFKKAIKEFKNVGIVFLVVFFLGLYFENTSYKKRTSQSSWLPSPFDSPVHLTSQSIWLPSPFDFPIHLTSQSTWLPSQVWRLRAYRTERTLGAAKPLWYLSSSLELAKNTVQRIVWVMLWHLNLLRGFGQSVAQSALWLLFWSNCSHLTASVLKLPGLLCLHQPGIWEANHSCSCRSSFFQQGICWLEAMILFFFTPWHGTWKCDCTCKILSPSNSWTSLYHITCVAEIWIKCLWGVACLALCHAAHSCGRWWPWCHRIWWAGPWGLRISFNFPWCCSPTMRWQLCL